jgi:dethiobiotin synthetase
MARMKGVFVTGTDTGVGKTKVSLGIMEYLRERGLRVTGMKPVASGCYRKEHSLRNQDAVLLRAHSSINVDYSMVNPYAFEAAVSPHIAARRQGDEIRLKKVVDCFRVLQGLAEFVLVEGVGGWQVPLNSNDRLSDMAGVLGLPVVLVVGLRLGCLNHAFLTSSAIERSGCTLAGWVGNLAEPGFDYLEENMESLSQAIPAPCLGFVPFIDGPQRVALGGCFELDHWLQD